jgi:hypothetical protein
MKEQAVKWPQEGVPDPTTHRRSGSHGTYVQVEGAVEGDQNPLSRQTAPNLKATQIHSQCEYCQFIAKFGFKISTKIQHHLLHGRLAYKLPFDWMSRPGPTQTATPSLQVLKLGPGPKPRPSSTLTKTPGCHIRTPISRTAAFADATY